MRLHMQIVQYNYIQDKYKNTKKCNKRQQKCNKNTKLKDTYANITIQLYTNRQVFIY